MTIDIVTLFPSFFDSPLKESLLGKAQEKGIFEINLVNLRDWGQGSHKQVDDTPYGGGAGMVIKADVLAAALKKLKKENSLVILTDPAGKLFKQQTAEELSKKDHLIIICGRYEGVDARFKDKYVDLELSIGDYILNGGEVAALTVIEAITRLLPGMLGSEESSQEESFSQTTLKNGQKVRLLEYPQYTRPEEFEGEKVPDVLLSGNHQEISNWRAKQALDKTKKERPDLLQ